MCKNQVLTFGLIKNYKHSVPCFNEIRQILWNLKIHVSIQLEFCLLYFTWISYIFCKSSRFIHQGCRNKHYLIYLSVKLSFVFWFTFYKKLSVPNSMKLHKLANILLQAYCCFDFINVSRCSYTTTFVLCHYHRVFEVLYFEYTLCNWV